MRRLHDQRVGRPVGPTVAPCERSSDRSARPVERNKHVKFIQPVVPTFASLNVNPTIGPTVGRTMHMRSPNQPIESRNKWRNKWLHFYRLRRFFDRRWRSNTLIATSTCVYPAVLGVILDSNLTMSQHVLRVCQNCYFQLRLIRRLRKALSVESKFLLVHALVNSRLDYCNSVLMHLPRSLVQKLQSVLNSAARLIFGLKRFDHITPALMDLHWLPYPQRITYKLCMIMFKCLRGAAPANLADYCTSTSLVPGRSALRYAAHGYIVDPSHRTDWGLRSFAVAGPSSWNALPVSLRSSSFSLDTFARHLKHIYLV